MLLFRKIKTKIKNGLGFLHHVTYRQPIPVIAGSHCKQDPSNPHAAGSFSLPQTTSKTTLSPTAPLVLSRMLCHMEAMEGGTRQKEQYVPTLRKYTWKRKENLLNEIRGENMHANKILELYKIMCTWTVC